MTPGTTYYWLGTQSIHMKNIKGGKRKEKEVVNIPPSSTNYPKKKGGKITRSRFLIGFFFFLGGRHMCARVKTISVYVSPSSSLRL